MSNLPGVPVAVLPKPGQAGRADDWSSAATPSLMSTHTFTRSPLLPPNEKAEDAGEGTLTHSTFNPDYDQVLPPRARSPTGQDAGFHS